MQDNDCARANRRRRNALERATTRRSAAALVAAAIAILPAAAPQAHDASATPIRHLVVVFQENASFDHYFATYPSAANPRGEPAFHAAPGTPDVNGLMGSASTANPNRLNGRNGTGASNPFRLDRSQAVTRSQDHGYGAEQAAFHAGLMDQFPMATGHPDPDAADRDNPSATTGMAMGYFDGNTVTALWNYAQRYAMSDNAYATTFGPSTPGAINLVSGQTNGVAGGAGLTDDDVIDDGNGGRSLVGDPDPANDACSHGTQVAMTGRTIGDLLSDAHVTWGWFQGGFDLSAVNADGSTGCDRRSRSRVDGKQPADYIAHHASFQYYASTANPTHARPASVAAIGHDGDPANHQYDLADFDRALRSGNLPAVSFLKATAAQNGHPGYSTPLDEQAFVVHVINALQRSPAWKDTAVVIAWDDSDGWYDHQMPPIVNQSSTPQDALTGPGACGDGASALPGTAPGTLHAQGRCGYGPRLPFLVVSPWARRNAVSHAVIDQTSILRFIEDNWLHGGRIGGGSFDALANPIDGMFDFRHARAPNSGRVILSEDTGLPAQPSTTRPTRNKP